LRRRESLSGLFAPAFVCKECGEGVAFQKPA
jgi:hypothetical protein